MAPIRLRKTPAAVGLSVSWTTLQKLSSTTRLVCQIKESDRVGRRCRLNSIDRGLRNATRWLALIGFAGLFLLALMTTLDVLMRWLFSAPLHGVNDVSAVVMGVVIACCIPANLAQRNNISVEIFGAMAGPRTSRALAAFSSLVVLVFIALMAWQFVPFTQGVYSSGRETWVLAWPVWPWWSVSTLLLIFAAIVQAANLTRDLAALFTGTGSGRTAAPDESDER